MTSQELYDSGYAIMVYDPMPDRWTFKHGETQYEVFDYDGPIETRNGMILARVDVLRRNATKGQSVENVGKV